MKLSHTLSFLIAFLFSALLFAQKQKEPIISIVGKSGVVTKPCSQAAPFIALKFRTGTVGSRMEGKNKDVSRASAYAILDGLDDAFFQELTDAFYVMFTEKMKKVGIGYKPAESIQSSSIYQDFCKDTAERHFNHRDFGTADVFTQRNVPFFNYPTIVLKPMKLMKEMGAGLTCMRLTVDFAEFDMDIAKSYGYNTITTSYSANVIPGIKVSSTFQEGALQSAMTGSFFNAPGTSMSNEKGQTAVFSQKRDIFVPFENPDVKKYDKSVPEFAGRAFRFFGGAVQLGTWVIKPTREDYKRAALAALGTYVDELIASIEREK